MAVMTTSFKRAYIYTVVFSVPDPAAIHCRPIPQLETPGHSQANLAQSLVGHTAPFSWVLVRTRFCLGPPSPPKSVSPVLWKFFNQIPLASKVKFPGDSPSLYQISRLGNLLWVLELSKQCGNFFGIIVLQFMGCLLGNSMVDLMETSCKKA